MTVTYVVNKPMQKYTKYLAQDTHSDLNAKFVSRYIYKFTSNNYKFIFRSGPEDWMGIPRTKSDKTNSI